MKNISVLCTAAAVLVSIATVMAENEKPVIINQPTSVKAKVGDSVTFTVGARDVNTNDKKSFTTSIMGIVDLDMIWVNRGTFMMGSPETELGHRDDEHLHQVTLTKGFWMGKYEVTQAQYKAVMGSLPRDENYYAVYGLGDNYPVCGCYSDDIMTFCDRLTQIERAAGKITMAYKYDLPTEEQWEYACRAGTTTALNSGKNLLTSWLDTDPNLDEVAWYLGNGGDTTHEVGQKLPNAWGFYDMHGNVAEYTRGDVDGFCVRGGGFCTFFSLGDCRSASKNTYDYQMWDYAGFRVVLVPVE